jgi:hypothetical protein
LRLHRILLSVRGPRASCTPIEGRPGPIGRPLWRRRCLSTPALLPASICSGRSCRLVAFPAAVGVVLSTRQRPPPALTRASSPQLPANLRGRLVPVAITPGSARRPGQYRAFSVVLSPVQGVGLSTSVCPGPVAMGRGAQRGRPANRDAGWKEGWEAARLLVGPGSRVTRVIGGGMGLRPSRQGGILYI